MNENEKAHALYRVAHVAFEDSCVELAGVVDALESVSARIRAAYRSKFDDMKVDVNFHEASALIENLPKRSEVQKIFNTWRDAHTSIQRAYNAIPVDERQVYADFADSD